MRRYTALIVLILLVVVAVVFLLTPPSLGNWKQIRLSFGGFTNSTAIILISNVGPATVVLRDEFELEYVGIASPVGSTVSNRIILKPTGTNLILEPLHQAGLQIPITSEGEKWIARLQFAPAGMQTRLAEYLNRRQYRFANSLPDTIRGVEVYEVSQEFSK